MFKFKNLAPKILPIFMVFGLVFALTGCLGGEEKPEKSITVVYHLNGGETPWDVELDIEGNYTDVLKGNRVENGATLMQPKKETWIFDGWYIDKDFQNKYPTFIVPENECDGRTLELYAKWNDKIVIDANNFDKYFNFSKEWNGGLNDINAKVNWSIKPQSMYSFSLQSQTINIMVNENLEEKNVELTPNNYYEYKGSVSGFSGGQTVGDILNSVYYIFPNESFNLYLLHNDPFKVALDLEGGSIDGQTEIDVFGGDILNYSTLPTPTKLGYRFIKWEGVGHIDGKPVIQNSTIKAIYKKEVTLSYKLGNEVIHSPVVILEGDNLVLPKIKKEGFAFFGWFNDAELTFKIEYDSYASDENFIYPSIKMYQDKVIYARFEPLYTISFETNGGSIKEEVKAANTLTPDLGDIPAKGNLYFGGWFTDIELQNPYKEQPISGDFKLYAKWLREVNINDENFTTYFNVTKIIDDAGSIIDGTFQEALKATVRFSIKEEYKNYPFNFYSTGANIEWHKLHDGECKDNSSSSSAFLGSFISRKFSLNNCHIKYGSVGSEVIYTPGSGENEFQIEKMDYNSNVVQNADHLFVKNFGSGLIFFPENATNI